MQTLSLFIDAYRELNSRRLFWITLIISGVVVLAFALIGINEQGLRIVVWDVSWPGVNSNVIPPSVFYKSMFLNLGVGIWLAWAATILALISTAGIFPDFIASGSIDLVLAKPIGRLRLFLTKYLSGLLFVALQVTVFCVASFFVLGFKGDVWAPALFLAIPIITVFFSYLFCICTLVGLWTRSTVASLLLTLLAWFFIFAVGAAENGLLGAKLMFQNEVESQQRRVETLEALAPSFPPDGSTAPGTAGQTEALDQARVELDRHQQTRDRIAFAHDIAMAVKTALPKTTETIGLLERKLIKMNELEQIMEESQNQSRERGHSQDEEIADLQMETAQQLRSRSVLWVIGTSLIFEAVVLALAGWIFCRRDF